MRRYVFLLPLFVALALPVPANEQRDSVSIAVVRDARPAVFVGDDGRPAGIFPDLLRRLLADIGRDPEFVTGHTLSTAFEAVQRGEVDLLLAVLKNPERERVLDFNTEPVMLSWGQVFVRADDRIESIYGLADARVALLRDDANGRAFAELMDSLGATFEPVNVSSYEEAGRALRDREVDAMVAYNTYRPPSSEIHPTSMVFAPAAAYVATAAGTNERLLEEIDVRLAALKANPSSYYHDIIARWLLPEQRPELPSWAATALIAVAVAFVVSAAAALWYRVRVKKTTRRLEQSQLRFRALFDLTADSILVFRSPGGTLGDIVEANDAICERLGYSRSELFTMTPDRLIGIDDAARCAATYAASDHTTPQIIRVTGRTRANDPVPYEVNVRRFTTSEGEFVIASGRDIGDRLQTEEQLKKSLETKETLLREIHHRVKNNLQTISSLLNIRMMSTGDEDLRRSLQEIANRVFAMGLLHRMLYEHDDLDAINVREYTHALARQIWSSHSAGSRHIELDVDCDDLMIDLDTALPFGLIVNEAITNALKHAFAGRSNGRICVSVRGSEEEVILRVQDDGVGLLGSKACNGGIGSKLISLLARQLDGTAELHSDGGTTVAVRFPCTCRMVAE